MERFAHTAREEIRDDTRIEIPWTDDDIVGFEYCFFGSRIERALISLEPRIHDILVDVVCTFSGILV